MIELTLKRRPTVKDTTLGVLFRGTVFRCYTLEDVIQQLLAANPTAGTS